MSLFLGQEPQQIYLNILFIAILYFKLLTLIGFSMILRGRLRGWMAEHP